VIPLHDNIKSRRWPLVNVTLILLNAAVFFIEITAPSPQALESLFSRWSLVPDLLFSSPFTQWPRVFTSMFIHGGWMHFLGNILYLWIFGDNVEDRMGHFRYLLFYLAAGTAAALTQSLFNPASRIPMMGASGAIAGVLGAYFLLYPKAKVLTFIPLWLFSRIVEIPAFFFLGFWFLMQTVQGLGSLAQQALRGDQGGVAWGAHAGGFLAGVILLPFLKRKRNRGFF